MKGNILKKLPLLLFTLLFFCGLAALLSRTALSQTNSVTIIGDSLTVGAQNALQAAYPGATIDAEVGRQWSTGISILQDLNLQGAVGNTIIFPLGSNGPIISRDIDALVNLADGKKIVLITLFTNDQNLSWIEPNNTLIRAAAQEHSNITLADWASVASDNISLISNDGIHPTSEGYSRLAQLIISAAGQSSSGSSGSSSSGSSRSYRSDSNEVRTRVGNPTTGDYTAGNIPQPPSDIRQGIIDKFGITMNGFDQDHLLWAWERLWEVSNTRFPNWVKGATIQRWGQQYSAQIGCFVGTSLNMRQFPGQPGYFKFHFLHELSHVAQMCNPRETTQRAAHENAYAVEGGISEYGKQGPACIPGTSAINEDHADTIAYFLDRSAGYVTTIQCGGPTNPPNPYNNGGFPLRAEAMTRALLN